MGLSLSADFKSASHLWEKSWRRVVQVVEILRIGTDNGDGRVVQGDAILLWIWGRGNIWNSIMLNLWLEHLINLATFPIYVHFVL